MNLNKLVNEFEKRLSKETKGYQGVPVAISGGVDSGVLAAFIKPTFVISVDVPGGDKFNETRYAKKVAKHLNLKHIIVKPNLKEFDKGVKESVKAIGRPIPHFNIFPLWAMYKKLNELGVKEVVLGDGPDETMCGYARNLIMAYMYKVYDFAAFKNYGALIDKVDWLAIYERMTGKYFNDWPRHKSALKAMNDVDIKLMRPDMDDMSNGIAKHFGIKNIRPYQDNPRFDKWQFNLPDEAKIKDTEYGKYILRLIAEKYLPKEIAWRKVKVGGPLFSPNKLKGWYKLEGEFGKTSWLEWQEEILNAK